MSKWLCRASKPGRPPQGSSNSISKCNFSRLQMMQLGPAQHLVRDWYNHYETNEEKLQIHWAAQGVTELTHYFHILWKEQSHLCQMKGTRDHLAVCPSLYQALLVHWACGNFKSPFILSSQKPALASYFLSIYVLLWLIPKLTCILWLAYKNKATERD